MNSSVSSAPAVWIKQRPCSLSEGVIIPDVGVVYLHKELMGRRPAYRRSTKMVFQHLARFHHMTVFTNLSYGLKIRKLPAKKIKARVVGALEAVH